MFETGRVCMKIAGRETGNYCVVLKRIDEHFVMITGPKQLTNVKRRRCNINHLEPLLEKIDITENASDSEIIKAFQKSSLIEKLNLTLPSKPVKKKEEPQPSKTSTEVKKEKKKQKQKSKHRAKKQETKTKQKKKPSTKKSK